VDNVTGDHPQVPFWRPAWDWFLKDHPGWWERHGPGPVYVIPQPVILSLAHSPASAGRSRVRKDLVTPPDVSAELAFTSLCERHAAAVTVHNGWQVLGCWDGRPVIAPPFDAPAFRYIEAPVDFSPDEAAGRRRQMAVVDSQRDVHQRLMTGWAAFVSFRPDYRAEVAAVRTLWEGVADRPELPMHIGQVADAARQADASREPDGRAEFCAAYLCLLRKWQLNRHVTWDLPVALDPRERMSLQTALHRFGPDWVVPIIPAYAAFPERADRAGTERAVRVRNAQTVGLPADAVDGELAGHEGKDHAPSHQLRMYLTELAVRSRHGSPRGLGVRLLAGLAKHLDVSVDRVKQLRKVYAHLFSSTARPGD
jgi:hypothetical protein